MQRHPARNIVCRDLSFYLSAVSPFLLSFFYSILSTFFLHFFPSLIVNITHIFNNGKSKAIELENATKELLLEILDARNESVHNINEEEEEDRILTKEDRMQCALSCRNWAIVTQQPRFLNFDQQEEKLQKTQIPFGAMSKRSISTFLSLNLKQVWSS